jgi:hypothetical protein
MVVPAPRTDAQCRKELGDYYALITELDHHIGLLLKTIEQNGLLDKTVVVFTADNGLAMGAHGLMGKQSMYEHSLRIPLLMAGPGIRRGTNCDPVYLYELYGRLARLCGLTAPAHVEQAQPGRPLYFGYRHFQRAVRLGSRKMIWSSNQREQYDLAQDPHEEKNLWGTPGAWPEQPFTTEAARARQFYGDSTHAA